MQCRKATKVGPRPRATANIRMWAAFIYMLYTHSIMPNKTLPELWQEWPEPKAFADFHQTSALHKITHRWGKRFQAGQSLAELPRNKKSKKIPEEVARRAASYLKTGQWMFIPGTNTRKAEFEHRYYTSVQMACAHCPELMAIRTTYNLTNRKFLKAMQQADPSLVRRTVRMRYGLDEDQKAARQERAATLYTRCVREPGWLNRVYFLDECGIVIDNVLKKGAHVYCDAHDAGYKDVIHTEKINGQKTTKLHILAVVNAQQGPVYLEFTTGTTGIRRRHNKKPLQPGHGPYKVSACRGQTQQMTVLL